MGRCQKYPPIGENQRNKLQKRLIRFNSLNSRVLPEIPAIHCGSPLPNSPSCPLPELSLIVLPAPSLSCQYATSAPVASMDCPKRKHTIAKRGAKWRMCLKLIIIRFPLSVSDVWHDYNLMWKKSQLVYIVVYPTPLTSTPYIRFIVDSENN